MAAPQKVERTFFRCGAFDFYGEKGCLRLVGEWGQRQRSNGNEAMYSAFEKEELKGDGALFVEESFRPLLFIVCLYFFIFPQCICRERQKQR